MAVNKKFKLSWNEKFRTYRAVPLHFAKVFNKVLLWKAYQCVTLR